MKSFALWCVASLLAGTGALLGADGAPAPKKKDAAALGRAAAALDTIQKALRDLPPGADVEQIKKALARLREEIDKDVQGRLSVAEADVEQWRERTHWSERLAARGCGRAQADYGKARLLAALQVAEAIRGELKGFGGARAK